MKHGGTLIPKYDPTIVTHIVTDAGVRHTLKALSLKSLSEIPDNIPTVTWDWVVSGYGRSNKRKSKLLLEKGDKGKRKAEDDRGDEDDDDDTFDFEFMHAAFPERMDAGWSWKNIRKGKQTGRMARDRDLALGADNALDDSGDISHISCVSSCEGIGHWRLTVIAVLFPRRVSRLKPGNTGSLSPCYRHHHLSSKPLTVGKPKSMQVQGKRGIH